MYNWSEFEGCVHERIAEWSVALWIYPLGLMSYYLKVLYVGSFFILDRNRYQLDYQLIINETLRCKVEIFHPPTML